MKIGLENSGQPRQPETANPSKQNFVLIKYPLSVWLTLTSGTTPTLGTIKISTFSKNSKSFKSSKSFKNSETFKKFQKLKNFKVGCLNFFPFPTSFCLQRLLLFYFRPKSTWMLLVVCKTWFYLFEIRISGML